jgi:hypothetical protein
VELFIIIIVVVVGDTHVKRNTLRVSIEICETNGQCLLIQIQLHRYVRTEDSVNHSHSGGAVNQFLLTLQDLK